MSDLDMNARYSVKGYEGIAFWIDDYPKRWEPLMFLDTDEDGNEIEVESDEGEEVEDRESGQVYAVMVGDDHRWLVDIEDLTLLDELDYCSVCGQIGCGHDGRDRE